jgi:hypothetical protein
MGIFSIFGKNKITINGKSYEVSGNNITVKNDSIYVDGKLVESCLTGNVKVEFTGDLANLDCTTATINGNVQGDVDGTTITCGDVGGYVDGATIKCGNIGGDVDGTNITCGDIKGNVDAVNVRKTKN